MDRISGLPDELLVKILLLLPTKTAVSTSSLSKRWEFLWMWLPKLEFDDKLYSVSQGKSLRAFIDRNLPLHRAPVLESLCLKLRGSNCKPEDIKLWISLAVFRCVRELEICFKSNPTKLNVLPSSLYTCKSLVTLKLAGDILVDVPRMVSLASLKYLKLEHLIYFNEESLKRFISICPILERLMVVFRSSDNIGTFTVVNPSLLKLLLYIPNKCKVDGYVINTPSLQYFKVIIRNSNNPYCLIENMPNLVYVDVRFLDIKSFLRSISSVKYLVLCSQATYGNGDCFVFKHLEKLTLCTSSANSLNLLVRFLKESPKLRVLEYYVFSYHKKDDPVDWNQPSTAPESILSSLETFRWSGYTGTPEESDVAVYILKNARHLKTATIKSIERQIPKLEMVKELTLSFRASTMCQLTFD